MRMMYNGQPVLSLDIIPGDGIDVSEDEISVTTPVRNILTMEEYKALPEEEQNTGVYFIPDEGEDSLGTANIYSTEELVIGRWIDGRPIYRRTCSGVSPAAGKIDKIMDLSESNIDWVVKGYGFIESTLDMRLVPIPTTRSSSVACLVGVNQDRSALNLYPLGGDFASKPFSYTIEYTKTTDEPTITISSEV